MSSFSPIGGPLLPVLLVQLGLLLGVASLLGRLAGGSACPQVVGELAADLVLWTVEDHRGADFLATPRRRSRALRSIG